MREWELYQAVIPGEPEEKGRSCLIGETVAGMDDGATKELDRSRARGLEQVSQCASRKERTKTLLTARAGDSKMYALQLASR